MSYEWKKWAHHELVLLERSENVNTYVISILKRAIDLSSALEEEPENFYDYISLLETLLDHRPLSALEDKNTEWIDIGETGNKKHKRHVSLVKLASGACWDYGIVWPIAVHQTPLNLSRDAVTAELFPIFFDKFPITFPYEPPKHGYRIYYDAIVDGDYIYWAIYKTRNVDTGVISDMNLYYRVSKEGEREEINPEDFHKLLEDDDE